MGYRPLAHPQIAALTGLTEKEVKKYSKMRFLIKTAFKSSLS